MTKIQSFKQELARVFDDNLHTKQWHNLLDYVIIGFIVLSTIEVFLSTYDGIVERWGTWLTVIDYLTTAFFTIEVSLRIWNADQLDPRYKGFWGRVRYCNKRVYFCSYREYDYRRCCRYGSRTSHFVPRQYQRYAVY